MELVFRNVHLTFREYAAANLRYTWRMQKGRLLWPVLAVVGLAVLQMGFQTRPDSDAPAGAAGPVLTYGIALGFVLLVAIPFSMWRALRKRYANTQFLQAPVTYTFGEAGIRIDAPTVQATSTWDTIGNLVPVNDELVLLTTRSLTAFFLNYRCLEAPATEADFRALLARHGVAVK